MRPEPGRRALVLGGAACAVLPGSAWGQVEAKFRTIEQQVGGRLGVYARDVRSGRTVGWRKDERFATASSFKALLAGAVLQRVDAGQERLDRTLTVPTTLLHHSPVTEKHAGGFMTVEALCAAIVTFSDNTGANLLFDTLGGPAGLTRILRSWGDPVTRLDRYELALNEALPGDPRDTTSPAAVSVTAEKLLLGRLLSAPSRERLTRWMVDSTTGLRRIRAGAPAGWRVADKTGTGARGATADFAVLWPPRGGPLVMATYIAESVKPLAEREAAMAAAARAALTALARA